MENSLSGKHVSELLDITESPWMPYVLAKASSSDDNFMASSDDDFMGSKQGVSSEKLRIPGLGRGCKLLKVEKNKPLGYELWNRFLRISSVYNVLVSKFKWTNGVSMSA
jgi:hypothetical protein